MNLLMSQKKLLLFETFTAMFAFKFIFVTMISPVLFEILSTNEALAANCALKWTLGVNHLVSFKPMFVKEVFVANVTLVLPLVVNDVKHRHVPFKSFRLPEVSVTNVTLERSFDDVSRRVPFEILTVTKVFLANLAFVRTLDAVDGPVTS